MPFVDKIFKIQSKILEKVKYIKTEEATKEALVRPMLTALGYDISDPTEVVPEFICDYGTKKGEKVDFAILKNQIPLIIIECKHCKSDLNTVDLSQLFRYFMVSDAKIAILTNGIIYKFFTDTQKSNKMDQMPFYEINLLNINESVLEELQRFSKNQFDMDGIISFATQSRQIKIIGEYLKNQFNTPSENFTKFLISELCLCNGKITANIVKQYQQIFKATCDKLIAQLATERIEQTQEHTIEEKEILKNEELLTETYTGKKPVSFMFLDEVIYIKTWKELLQKFTEIIWKNHPELFSKTLNIKGNSRSYFTTDQTSLVYPIPIKDSGYFAEGNASANRIVSICRRLLEVFGYNKEELKINSQ